MKYLKLYVRMVRYRSAMVLVLFLLLGAAWHTDISKFAPQLTLAAIALVSAYVCATVTNDLIDWEIDLINLKGHADRPLVTGEGSRRDLKIVALLAAFVSLTCGLLINPPSLIAIVIILVWNIAYSLPIMHISYRPVLTPFYLVVGYVIIPYLAGILAVGSNVSGHDGLLLPSLYSLFIARISLKDFRDREGDAKNHKPTFILKYGKSATCLLSITGLAIGFTLIVAALASLPWVSLGLLPFFIALLATNMRLARTSNKHIELITIGFGARIGNGMLCTLLGVLILRTSHAAASTQILFVLVTLGIYTYAFVEFWSNPESFSFGKNLAR